MKNEDNLQLGNENIDNLYPILVQTNERMIKVDIYIYIFQIFCTLYLEQQR